MEASDAFAGGVEISDAEDPFEGTDFGDFGEEDKPTEPVVEPDVPVDTSDLPVVDREGQRVEPQNEGGQPDGSPSPLAPDAASVESAEAPAAPEPPPPPQAAPAPAEHTQHAPPPVTPPPGSSDPAREAREYEEHHGERPAAPPQQEEESSPAPAAPAPAAAGSEPAPEPEADPTTDGASGTASAEATGDGGGDRTTASNGSTEVAPEPVEATDKRGRRVKRKYVLLRVTGPGKFEQIAWYVDKSNTMVAKGAEGARKQTVALARDTDEALKVGYVAVGRPQDGVSLIAVAQQNFQVRKIRPRPPEPSKERLEIT